MFLRTDSFGNTELITQKLQNSRLPVQPHGLYFSEVQLRVGGGFNPQTLGQLSRPKSAKTMIHHLSSAKYPFKHIPSSKWCRRCQPAASVNFAQLLEIFLIIFYFSISPSATNEKLQSLQWMSLSIQISNVVGLAGSLEFEPQIWGHLHLCWVWWFLGMPVCKSQIFSQKNMFRIYPFSHNHWSGKLP